MTTTGKKIGIYILTPVFAPEIGGIETHLSDLCQILSRRDDYQCLVATYQPIFVQKSNASPPVETIGCFEVHRFAWFAPGLFDRLITKSTVIAELYLAPYYFLRSFCLLWARRREIQIIHAQGLMAAIVGRILAGLFRKPLIASTHAFYHLDQPRLMNRIVRWALRGAGRVLTLLQHSHDEVVQLGVPAAQVEVFRYWIDDTRFYPADQMECRQQLNWPDRFTILFTGRFIEVKGVRLLLNLARQWPEDITLVLAGGGPLQAEIEAAVRGNPRIIIMPPQKNEEMRRLYSAADVLVVPSLWQEGCGRVILEAMTCGIPVIGSRRGGIPEVITADCGILIEPAEDTLRAAILELKNDPARLARMRAAARAYAEQMFSCRNAETILRAYRDALVARRPTAAAKERHDAAKTD